MLGDAVIEAALIAVASLCIGWFSSERRWEDVAFVAALYGATFVVVLSKLGMFVEEAELRNRFGVSTVIGSIFVLVAAPYLIGLVLGMDKGR
jgi:hypothetical protein